MRKPEMDGTVSVLQGLEHNEGGSFGISGQGRVEDPASFIRKQAAAGAR